MGNPDFATSLAKAIVLATNSQAVQSCFQGSNWIIVKRQGLLVTAQDFMLFCALFICGRTFPEAAGAIVVPSTAPVL